MWAPPWGTPSPPPPPPLPGEDIPAAAAGGGAPAADPPAADPGVDPPADAADAEGGGEDVVDMAVCVRAGSFRCRGVFVPAMEGGGGSLGASGCR